jgi:hypothetical protein
MYLVFVFLFVTVIRVVSILMQGRALVSCYNYLLKHIEHIVLKCLDLLCFCYQRFCMQWVLVK